ncbi:MAG: hypothetical protein CMM15_02225 [Rhodospirillaceae bacterium]|nr:hypothetical protein [Rhodospirillaceae bacterium]OUU28856.1 MAG: hypothetical protein CBB97_03710 [Candidatus Endolissoclinum sp. TMED37]|tara:strand:+ start:111 stop:479 length:369 start_codon:yes stop_codon:yes gene_type:complete
MGKSVKTGKFPWSIKGVSVEARDFVRTAAAERGITMGEWLTNVIQNETKAFQSTSVSQQKTNDVFKTPQMVTEVPKRAEDRLLKKLDETEDRVLEAVKPLKEIVLKLSLRLEALESRHEIER